MFTICDIINIIYDVNVKYKTFIILEKHGEYFYNIGISYSFKLVNILVIVQKLRCMSYVKLTPIQSKASTLMSIELGVNSENCWV